MIDVPTDVARVIAGRGAGTQSFLAIRAAAGWRLLVIRALLGATALVHELGVVTRNTADFHRAGLRLLDPWVAAG